MLNLPSHIISFIYHYCLDLKMTSWLGAGKENEYVDRLNKAEVRRGVDGYIQLKCRRFGGKKAFKLHLRFFKMI